MSESKIECADRTWYPQDALTLDLRFERVVLPARPDKLDAPLRWRKAARARVLGDLFHESLPFEAIDRVFAVMALAQRHSFQILTKRPERLREWAKSEWSTDRLLALFGDLAKWQPDVDVRKISFAIEGGRMLPLPNVWLGVSVEDQASANARIPTLLETPAAVRWVSYEPALGPVDFQRVKVACGAWAIDCSCSAGRPCEVHRRLDWLIVGGESGPGARPCDVAWIRSVRDQCAAAGVPVFIKQLGRVVEARNDQIADVWPDETETNVSAAFQGAPVRVFLRHPKGGNPDEWPEDLRVRQFPAGARHG